MRTTQEHTVQGHTYTIQQLGAKTGRKVMARLFKVVGPAMAADDLDMRALVDGLSDETLDYICDTFAKATQFSPPESPERKFVLADQFDEHFAGRYGAMLRWLWACVETNYGNFLSELGIDPTMLAKNMESAKSLTKRSQTRPSGASSNTDTDAS